MTKKREDYLPGGATFSGGMSTGFCGLVSGADGGVLKYEFHCAPGADHTQIQIRYDGIDGLCIDRLFGFDNRDGIFPIHRDMKFLLLAGTYMGVAQGAFDFTVQYLRGATDGRGDGARRNPFKQHAVAEMFIRLEQMRALFVRAIREARVDPPRLSRLRAYAAQYTIMENANDICRLAIRTCGGQSMLKSLPLERLYRDSRCGSLMLPWTAELCLDRLGRECLYEAGERDEAIDA